MLCLSESHAQHETRMIEIADGGSILPVAHCGYVLVHEPITP